jgi:hypothetical protein
MNVCALTKTTTKTTTTQGYIIINNHSARMFEGRKKVRNIKSF